MLPLSAGDYVLPAAPSSTGIRIQDAPAISVNRMVTSQSYVGPGLLPLTWSMAPEATGPSRRQKADFRPAVDTGVLNAYITFRILSVLLAQIV